MEVEEGYYETPRGITHEKIATQVGVATTTVSEDLRKIEQRVFSTLSVPNQISSHALEA
ncbi:helix-turn-helix domain-containing protein [Haloferax gibbonsii]|uniref:helix-turn-helix domain-containing protein n=1 Tax=Haloferax gibbonsii TaxID=35746 RepID=UPI0022B097C0|nr:helix-turn-helix domain-containing protein [Haloferax gibbonsii]